MVPRIISSIESLAKHLNLNLEQVHLHTPDQVWSSLAPIQCAGDIDHVTFTVQESALSTLSIGKCKIFEGTFPVVDDVILFNQMHHNGELKALSLSGDGGSTLNEKMANR